MTRLLEATKVYKRQSEDADIDLTSTVEKEREKDKVPTAAKNKTAKGTVCEYAKCCKRFPTMNEIVKDDLKKTALETSIYM